MNFEQLLEKASEFPGITTDSRACVPGGVFIAGGGPEAEQARFVADALAKSVAWVVADSPALLTLAGAKGIVVEDFRKAAAMLACSRYQHPARKMLMLGVTGTCGKTTSAFLMESILEAAGYQVGLIGTVAFRFAGKTLPSTHTTPGALELQALLAQMQQAGCTAVVMEVSSHALKQHRVLGIPFDGVLFTNLSHEHLDLHKTMEDYFETKALLFTEYLHFSKNLGKNPVAAVHTQDAYGMELLRRMQAKGLVARPFSLASRPLTFSASGITGTTGNTPFSSPLVGRFNAENVLGVVELMEGLGIAEQAIVAGLDRLRFVPGRMERVDDPRGAHLFVDYAHKPGALEVVLKTLRESLQGSSGRLLVLFGCGGDRDQLKRPEMGRIATRLADQVWVTSDNPRTEEPEAIVQAILSGVPDDLRQKCVAQLDRREAIRAAVAEARAGDILLVAGRGHEQDQVVGTSKVHFDDREEVKVALGAMVHQQELPGTL